MVHIRTYFANGLTTDANAQSNIVMLYMFLGFVGFTTTLVLSGMISFQEEYTDTTYYKVIFGTTLATGITAGLDFGIVTAKYITPITIALGSVATFFSVAMWSRDVESHTKLALLIVQLCSNSIMMGVIFNQNRDALEKRPYAKLMSTSDTFMNPIYTQ